MVVRTQVTVYTKQKEIFDLKFRWNGNNHRKMEKKSLHTQEDEVMRQILLVPESLQWEASSAGQDTKRQTYRVECLTGAPWPQWLGLCRDDTHHAEMERFAEVHLLQQMQQPLPHLLWFEKQTMDGLERTTFTQEVQNC